METKRLRWNDFWAWYRQLKFSSVIGMLLTGDRITCCDEVIGVLDENRICGVATIAPNGEEMSGQPTIVAVYVMPGLRRHGYGVPLLEATVRRCLERGFAKIHIDAMSTGMINAIAKIAPELREKLEVVDWNGVMDDMLEHEQ